MLAEEGLENVFQRHAYLAGGTRAAVIEGWKLKLCAVAPKWYSDTVSAIMVPEGINGAEVIARAFKRYNLALGAGLSKVAGKLFRIGHLGDLNELMLLGGDRGRGNGDARCRRQDRAGKRRRRRAELLAQHAARRKSASGRNGQGGVTPPSRLPRSRLAQGEGAQARGRDRIRRIPQNLARGDRAAARRAPTSRS